jgi:dynein heavy chain
LIEPLKFALRVEIKAWKLMFGKELNKQYREKMEGILKFVDDCSKRLARPIRDLEDVREAMSALREIRENQIAFDMQLGPIEVHLNDF